MSKTRLVIDLSSPANPRSRSLRRSRTDDPIEASGSIIMSSTSVFKRRTRSSLASSTVGSVADDDTDEFPQPSTIGLSAVSKGKGKAIASRASMSSVSTVNDSAASSGYSTPATSAIATPMTEPKQEEIKSLKRPRGRPASTLPKPLPPAALNAFQIAKNLRNSEFSLNPIGNKRKRNGDGDEDGDSDDSDNSPDAKLAKTLQAEEDAKMDTFIDEQEHNTPRRTRRAPRAIRPKIDFISDFTEDEDEDDFEPIVRARKTTTSFASSTSKKTTKLGSKKAKSYIPDSDESEFVASDDDKVSAIDSDSSDVPLATLSAIKKVVMQKMNDSMDEVVRQQSTSFRARGNTSRGRGRARGGSRLSSGRAGAATTSTSSTSNTKIEEAESSTAVLDAFDSLDSSAEELLPPFTDSDISETDDDARNLNLYERYQQKKLEKRAAMDRARLESHHPELLTMWKDLENLPAIKTRRAEQPTNISRELKPFQLEGLSWMQDMEKTEWGGGLLGDEMGMGKTIQAVSLIMSDYPAKNPSLVLIPPVALMQWQQEIGDYTDGTLKTFVFHGTNKNTKGMTLKELKKYDVILMSYNSLESMWRHQEKGFKRKEEVHFQKSVIHQLQFHRVILDEAHNIKTRTTGVAKACFALKADHKWCLSGTPLQNRIGEFFSLVRFLDIRPFACYFCKQCPCSTLEWSMNADNRCTGCSHSGMQHVSVFNQELLNPIQKHGNKGPGKVAFAKLRLLTDRFMLRRVKRDHSSAMELPAKEIQVDRQFFGEEENDFAGSIMNSGTRKFETYVAQGVLLNNYANIFGLIMQMRQVADHPDLILKKNGEGGQNILICCICDETAEEAIRSTCRHDFCRSCVRNYLKSSDETNTQPDCPQCHIPLSIDLEQPEMEQDQALVKKSSIINRIKMENWTSSSKIEALVHDLHSLRSRNSSSKSIIFSQFTTMLQLVEWRLRRAGITTVMLDGSMTPAQRQASINHFMTDVNVECFLVSLKAGGVALNLTEASKVFIVDPWWNPAAEWQSADRCHRIGQCRPCSITRLCIEDSVESRMVLLQEKKANMINSTINADDTAMESLTPEDMQFLFRGN